MMPPTHDPEPAPDEEPTELAAELDIELTDPFKASATITIWTTPRLTRLVVERLADRISAELIDNGSVELGDSINLGSQAARVDARRAVDELVDDGLVPLPGVVDQDHDAALRCAACGRLLGTVSAPCPACDDYEPGHPRNEPAPELVAQRELAAKLAAAAGRSATVVRSCVACQGSGCVPGEDCTDAPGAAHTCELGVCTVCRGVGSIPAYEDPYSGEAPAGQNEPSGGVDTPIGAPAVQPAPTP